MSDLRDARILVTAFEPWAEHRVNTSQIAVEGLDGQVIGGCRVKVLHLPVEWEEAPKQLLEQVVEVEPSAIVAFGMHAGDFWRVELIAHNEDVRDGVASTIIDEAPRIHTTGLPAAAVLGTLLEAGISAQPSEDAGRFLCNHVFFWTMHAVSEGAAPAISGFVHVPAPVVDEPGGPVRNADTLQEGARLVIEAVARAVGRYRVA